MTSLKKPKSIISSLKSSAVLPNKEPKNEHTNNRDIAFV